MKRTISQRFSSVYIGDLDGKFEDAIKYLQRTLEELKANNPGWDFNLEFDSWVDGSSTWLVYRVREETDEEYKARLKKEKDLLKRNADKVREKELKEYERLKKKFEGK